MALIRRPPARPRQTPLPPASWLAGVADPAWLAVALTVLARALGVSDPARALVSSLALVPDEARARSADRSDPPAPGTPVSADPTRGPAGRPDRSGPGAPDHGGAGADDDIDLTGGTGRSGTSTGGLVDGGITTGPATTGTSAPAGAATAPSPQPSQVPSTGAQGGAGKGRSPSVGSGGLDGSATDDLETPALATDEAGGD